MRKPPPKLPSGQTWRQGWLKWLLGVYTKRFNIRHKLCGHLFAGRYKALVVEGSGNGYPRTVCDYVHLNPVRARLLPPEAALESFAWSSYREYPKPAGQRPSWLRVDRLLGEKGIPKDSEAGRRQLGVLIERRRAEESEADLQKAERVVKEELGRLGWEEDDLGARRKGHRAKVMLARRLRQETTMSLKWIAQRLQMGSWTCVSNLLNEQPQTQPQAQEILQRMQALSRQVIFETRPSPPRRKRLGKRARRRKGGQGG